MLIRKIYLVLSISLFLNSIGHAQASHLSFAQIQRVKALKQRLADVDDKSLQETIREIEKSRHPLIDLEMKEAVAQAYTDIIKEYSIQRQEKKQWLYSMVCLNMAYLQFGGVQGKPGSTTELNRLIRKELQEYLPADFFKQLGNSYSLG